MEIEQLKPVLEALIFASEEPLSLNALSLILGEETSKENISQALNSLVQDYQDSESKGLLLRQVGEGYQFVTKPNLATWIEKLGGNKPKSLSQAALETLAIIAYRQPLVRSEVEVIRGVDSGAVLKTLLERGLIKILGRKEEAGQPLIYGTTSSFLELFSLKNLEELPSMKEVEQLVDHQNQGEVKAGSDVEDLQLESTHETEWVVEGTSEELGNEALALADLENSIKEIKRLEKEIFPKEEPESADPVPLDKPPPEPEF